MSGPHLAQQIWKEHPGFKTLFVSGHAWDSVQRNFSLTKEYSFLQKPFDSITLARAVRRCLDHEADLNSAADRLHHYAPGPVREHELSHT
jgi:DNA-binding NtrC family response regulator